MAAAHLLIDRIPIPVERLKSRNPDAHSVIGESVNDSSFLQTLLTYGTFDGYFYVSRPDSGIDFQEHYRDFGRLKPITLSSLHLLDQCGPLLLFTSSILFQRYASFRLARKHPEWPICGVTHTLSTIYPRVSFGSPKLFPYDALICTTPSARQALEQIMHEHSHSTAVMQPLPQLPAIRYPVIPLGVDPAKVGEPALRGAARHEFEIEEPAVVFLFLGRLAQLNKADLHPVIRIFLEERGLPPNALLLIAGDDTRHHLAAELRAFAGKFPSARKVRVLPDVTAGQKRRLLSAADVFLAVSDTIEETFGLSVVEAMMSGMPVIASDWNGYRYLVRHGSDGWLVPTYMYGDGLELSAISPLFGSEYHYGQRAYTDLDALNHAMCILACKPELRKQLGEAACKRAQSEFSWPNVLGRYEELWRDQLKDGAAARPSSEDLRYPAVYDSVAAFRHYATYAISREGRLSVSPVCDVLLPLARQNSLFLRPDPALVPQVDEQIIDQCRKAGVASIGDIVDQLQRPDLPEMLLISHICRLLKNGLLHLDHAEKAKDARRDGETYS